MDITFYLEATILFIVLALMITLFIGYMYLIICLSYFIFGYLPFISARTLTSDELIDLKKYGIAHRTNTKGKDGIMKLSKIKGRRGRVAYSNHFKKSAYFFAVAYINHGESFNFSFKHHYEIRINELTDEQIKQIRIRDYDKALIFNGDFRFDDTNIITIIKLNNKEYSIIEKIYFTIKMFFSMKIDKYIVCLFGCTIISTLIFLPLSCLIFKVLL